MFDNSNKSEIIDRIHFPKSEHPAIMTLKQLEAFYWAATCANFAIAAQRINVSLSSLSKRISELEQSLDVVLFDRSGHRATLTDAGQGLMPQALALLDSRLIDDWLLANQVSSAERISCNNWGAVAGMIIAGVGVGMLPQAWAERLVTQKRLVAPKDHSGLAPLTYSFHWRRGDSRPLLEKMRVLATRCADFSADMLLPLAS